MPIWPRSHSLGDLQGEIDSKTEGSQKTVDCFPQGVLDITKKSISFDGSGQVAEQLMAKNKGGAVSVKGKAKELYFPTSIPPSGTFPLFLPRNSEVLSPLLSRDLAWTALENHNKSNLGVGRTEHCPGLKAITGAEQKDLGEAKSQPKTSSQPPPVPAKKSRERLSNGHYHPPSAPCSPDVPSLPAKKTTLSSPIDAHVLTFCKSSSEQEPRSPSCVRPPWFSDLPETSSIQQHVLKLGPSSARKPPCNRGLDMELLIENKLQSEDIDLTEDPYSDKVREGDLKASL